MTSKRRIKQLLYKIKEIDKEIDDLMKGDVTQEHVIRRINFLQLEISILRKKIEYLEKGLSEFGMCIPYIEN